MVVRYFVTTLLISSVVTLDVLARSAFKTDKYIDVILKVPP